MINGLYIHIPFCDGKCGYCAFYSVRYDGQQADRYLAALETELQLSPPVAPETIYVGGGTPSLLSTPQWTRLIAMIRQQCDLSRLVEWSVEMNPGSAHPDLLAMLRAAGVNRISLGAQSFDDEILYWLGRRHSVDDIVRSVDLIHAAGISNFGLDLIACVPGCGLDRWHHTLQRAIALAPAHLSVYALTDEEGTRLNNAIGRGDTALLSDDEQLCMLNTAVELLADAGYARYEISNYAKPGRECRHNLACWRGEDYLGLGTAAASHVNLCRWTNVADLPTYLTALEQRAAPACDVEHLTPERERQDRVIFGLRMAEGVPADVAHDQTQALHALAADGLVTLQQGRWRLTSRGWHLADYVASELL